MYFHQEDKKTLKKFFCVGKCRWVPSSLSAATILNMRTRSVMGLFLRRFASW